MDGDDKLKADFIKKNGVTKCETADHRPKRFDDPAAEYIARNGAKTTQKYRNKKHGANNHLEGGQKRPWDDKAGAKRQRERDESRGEKDD